jgi:hypothetical protein
MGCCTLVRSKTEEVRRKIGNVIYTAYLSWRASRCLLSDEGFHSDDYACNETVAEHSHVCTLVGLHFIKPRTHLGSHCKACAR